METKMTYAQLVESLEQLPYDEKGEIEELLHKMRIEESRLQIRKNAEESRKEYAEGKITFSSDMDTLKGML